MTTPLVGEVRDRTHSTRRFSIVYDAMLILSLHWALVLYINSTFLKQFVSDAAVGALYTIGSALTLIAFLFTARVLRKLGNYTLTLSLACIEVLVLVGLAFSESLRVAVPLFILHQALVPLLLFNLDVFTEDVVGSDEGITGGTRGVVLSIMSLAGAVAPLIAGMLVVAGEAQFRLVYLLSATIMLAFCIYVMRNFRAFKDAPYNDIRLFDTLRNFWVHQNLRFVFCAQFLLQLFFSWMVIYVPLYLFTVVGFSWNEIGSILFIALMAYVLLEYPVGKLADRIGEKEMMIVGFVILAISTGYISFLDSQLILPWMAILFMTRVGASLVETTTESYFFKHTRASNAAAISFFRASRPLAYIAGALLGSLTLLYVPFGFTFLILGIVLIPGIICAGMLVDTK